MADRSIPEQVPPEKMLAPKKKYFDKATNAGNKARMSALRARITQSRDGTPHQQHLAHEQHMANVKNNPKKYG